MSQAAYALVGLTALVAALVAVLVFAALRFGAAMRDMRGQLREGGAERAFMGAALQEAIEKLRAQERQTAARAEASERLSGGIVASLASGLLVAGLDRGVRILNPAGLRLLRLSSAPDGADYRAVLAHATALSAVIDECLATGRPIVRRTLELPQPSAAPLHFGVTASPLFDDRGDVHGAVCLFSDLTDIVALEEQLRLKDSLARLGELTAGLAHEFRNGLATIHGYARLIDVDKLPPAYRPYVEGIRQETDDLGGVVTNFLAFARPTELVLGPVDLRAVIERAVSDVRGDVEGRGGSLAVSGEFGIVEGDDVLLRQAIGNLLRNSVEAAVAADVTPRIAVESSVDPGHHVVRLAVHDNGPGVDPGLADRIFTPFFSTKGRGTGLGLALVQKIVVTHNGRVSVGVSRLGGAVFQLTLPLRAAG